MLQLPAKFGIATSSFPQVPPNPQPSTLNPTTLTCSMVEPSGMGIVFKEKAWQGLGFRVQGLGFRV